MKYPIFEYMRNNNLESLLETFQITGPTWSRGSLKSQIDDIWRSSDYRSKIGVEELHKGGKKKETKVNKIQFEQHGQQQMARVQHGIVKGIEKQIGNAQVYTKEKKDGEDILGLFKGSNQNAQSIKTNKQSFEDTKCNETAY
ncbi:16167_t:CDS:2, partial [Gigaspora margarita]